MIDFTSPVRRILSAPIFLIASASTLVWSTGLLLVRAGQAGDQATEAMISTLFLFGGGLAAGSLAVALERQLYRSLGFVPIGLLGAALCQVWARWAPGHHGPAFVMGAMVGLVTIPLCANCQARLPWQHLARGFAILTAGVLAGSLSVTCLAAGLDRAGYLDISRQIPLAALAMAACALASFWLWLREFLELVFESFLWPVYRVRVWGPGLSSIPRRGPAIVFANHAAWFDPIWVGKVMPRKLIPLMTSKYFDLPVLHWIMRHVVRAIRVPDLTFRRQAPELNEAIHVLDRGECLLIFPEGGMRRKPEQEIGPFGQGIWRILQQRPDTPLIACWIDGNWGSSTSYYNGQPFKGKPLDWWKRIDIGVAPAERLSPELLKDQRATRRHLMDACLRARQYIRSRGKPESGSER
jgi:1-acyl-sn-glycerol-3-phosphate acyltransferase